MKDKKNKTRGKKGGKIPKRKHIRYGDFFVS
jgi:hypothetical protein